MVLTRSPPRFAVAGFSREKVAVAYSRSNSTSQYEGPARWLKRRVQDTNGRGTLVTSRQRSPLCPPFQPSPRARMATAGCHDEIGACGKYTGKAPSNHEVAE